MKDVIKREGAATVDTVYSNSLQRKLQYEFGIVKKRQRIRGYYRNPPNVLIIHCGIRHFRIIFRPNKLNLALDGIKIVGYWRFIDTISI